VGTVLMGNVSPPCPVTAEVASPAWLASACLAWLWEAMEKSFRIGSRPCTSPTASKHSY
jgi:hypothetical protein